MAISADQKATILNEYQRVAGDTGSPEVQVALSESVNRILSVAVVHEFLSYNSAGVINLREVAQRIVDQMTEGVMDPEAHIRFRLSGPSIYLSAQKATACALVLNELLLNAVEHGYENRDVGKVTVALDGRELPDNLIPPQADGKVHEVRACVF